MRVVSTITRIAFVLLDQADGEPVALSNARLADLTDTSDRNVRRCLGQLVEAGAVEIRQSSRYDRWAGTRLLVPDHTRIKELMGVSPRKDDEAE